MWIPPPVGCRDDAMRRSPGILGRFGCRGGPPCCFGGHAPNDWAPFPGGDSQWYRNVLKTPAITLTVDGVMWNGKATPITQPAGVREVVEKFRAKYGADEVAKYYSKFDVAAAVPLA